jgi:hypothetical protein
LTSAFAASLKAMPVDYPVPLDRDRAVARAWKVATLPATFVLNADLRPRPFKEAEFAWDRIDPGKFFECSHGRRRSAQ